LKKKNITNVFGGISKAFCCLKPFGTADLELPQLGVHRKSSASRIGDDSEIPRPITVWMYKTPYEINYQPQQVFSPDFFSIQKNITFFPAVNSEKQHLPTKKSRAAFCFPEKERGNSVNYAKNCSLNC